MPAQWWLVPHDDHMHFARSVDPGDQAQLDVARLAGSCDQGEARRQGFRSTYRPGAEEIEQVRHEPGALGHCDMDWRKQAEAARLTGSGAEDHAAGLGNKVIRRGNAEVGRKECLAEL